MFSRSIRTASRSGLTFKRFNSHGHHHEPVKETEVNLTKVFGVAIAGAVSWVFYKNYKAGNDPIFKTGLYNVVEERPHKRTENYLKRYETSFVKGFIRDKGGIGQKQYKRKAEGALPVALIPTHSPEGNQYGAGIKLSELGPRRENIQYFAPLK